MGGRLIEDWNEGGGYELGTIITWQPGLRLAFQYRNEHFPPMPTEVEVRFEATSDGTRVTLEHRFLERLPPQEQERVERYAWLELMRWFTEYVERSKGTVAERG